MLHSPRSHPNLRLPQPLLATPASAGPKPLGLHRGARLALRFRAEGPAHMPSMSGQAVASAPFLENLETCACRVICSTIWAMARREVLVQLDDDLVGQLDALAERAGTSRSELLRRGALAVLQAAELAEADQQLVEA